MIGYVYYHSCIFIVKWFICLKYFNRIHYYRIVFIQSCLTSRRQANGWKLVIQQSQSQPWWVPFWNYIKVVSPWWWTTVLCYLDIQSWFTLMVCYHGSKSYFYIRNNLMKNKIRWRGNLCLIHLSSIDDFSMTALLQLYGYDARHVKAIWPFQLFSYGVLSVSSHLGVKETF